MRELCERCGQRGSMLRLVEIGGDGRRALRLCGPCAEEAGLPVSAREGLFDTRAIWESVMSSFASERKGEEADEKLACPRCGWTFDRFESDGRLGCPACYQTFMGDMTRLLKDYHGANHHRGKVPHRIGRRIDLRRRILNVKESIQTAVGEERFEDAARLRDELRDLEEAMQDLPGAPGANA